MITRQMTINASNGFHVKYETDLMLLIKIRILYSTSSWIRGCAVRPLSAAFEILFAFM